jgi:hypothetical protein
MRFLQSDQRPDTGTGETVTALVKHYAMNSCGGTENKLHAFLASASRSKCVKDLCNYMVGNNKIRDMTLPPAFLLPSSIASFAQLCIPHEHADFAN